MLSFLRSLFSAFGEFFGFLKQNQLINAGKTEVIATQQKEDAVVLEKANEARKEAALAAAASRSLGSLPDDGFRRD